MWNIALSNNDCLSTKMIVENTNCFTRKNLHLVDMSYATPYIDFKSGKHLKQSKVQSTLNMKNEFQSHNRLNGYRTSRKDDLEMLCNLLIYLCNNYELPDFEYPSSCSNDLDKKFYFLMSYKSSFPLSKLCKIATF